MSTAIGYAFRFKDGIDLQQAIQLCWDLRPRMRKEQNAVLAKNMAAIAERKLVAKLRFGRDDGRKPLNHALDAWRLARKEPNHYERHSWNVQADVMLYSIVYGGESIILGKSIVGPQLFHNIIMRNLPVVDYHYQNQTDKPGHISNDKWALRASHWAEALPGVGVPTDNGLMVRLGYTDPPWPEMKDILRYMRFEDVVERQARRIILKDHAAAISAARTKAKRTGGIFTSVMRANQDAIEWLKLPEGIAALAEEEGRLRNVLPNPITREHL